jgi:hypothetical protein
MEIEMAIDFETLNSEDVIDVRDIIARVEELQSDFDLDPELLGEEEREELIFLSTILHELCGYGGDEQWRGDWYPITLIRESHFVDYVQEMLEDCGEIPRDLPHYIYIDWQATAREVQVDYSEVEVDGVTYFYR